MNEFKLEKIIKYEFKNKDLIRLALTHSSLGIEESNRHLNNERLEFIGDAFLDAIVGAEIYRRLPDVTEGRLTKVRADVVRESALGEVALGISLGDFMNMSTGEEHLGGRTRASSLADCLEAVIGAVFMDGGYDKAEGVVLRLFAETIDNAISGKLSDDYKSRLQEKVQENGKLNLAYKIDKYEGPDHDKTFYMHVEQDGKIIGRGSGHSKKEAEQKAAKAALENWE